MSSRGHVLVQVLVTCVVISVIAAGLMQMAMLTYTISARGASGASAKKRAESSFNALMVEWNASGVCSDLTGRYNCSLLGGGASCDCTPSSTVDPRVTATNSGGNWVVTVNAPAN